VGPSGSEEAECGVEVDEEGRVEIKQEREDDGEEEGGSDDALPLSVRVVVVEIWESPVMFTVRRSGDV
jgi:hypothetical protein